jgi:hypothetical protein
MKETIQAWIDQGWQLFYLNSGMIFICLLVALASLLIHLPFRADEEDFEGLPKRRGKMLRRQRREYVKTLAVDDFVDRVEERVYNGTITREEAKELYRDFKKCFPVKDLFPSPELLKEAIKRRLALGIHTPVELPDKKAKPRHMFDKVA